MTSHEGHEMTETPRQTTIQFPDTEDKSAPLRQTTIQFTSLDTEEKSGPPRQTTINFDDNILTLRKTRTTAGTGYDDGIYSMRSVSRRGSMKFRRASTTEIEDDDPGIRQAGDYKTKQVFRGRTLLLLAYQSIGVIYGDIGTSPLYVYSSTFTDTPSKDDLVGVLSIVLWSLIMMVTVKYILIILHMDNDGEGGTFSTYSLLSRYLNIANRDPREASLVQMKRYRSGELGYAGQALRRGIEHSKFVKTCLKVIGVLAVTMVLSDGVLTPAQSVLGAVQGIQVVDPSLAQGVIIGVTDAILVFLFAIQPFGTGKLAVCFAPIIIIWLGFNMVFGIYNLVKYDWTVLKAFNPGYAFGYLAAKKEDGWRSLGGILLAFTGVEALFADLGAFSRHAIQLSWLCYAFPCLILAYTGQAAYISVFPDAYSNPFFNAAPSGTIYPSLVIAILAAIVASQAIITATFQLIAQITKLSFCPQIKVVHTSSTHHGQLYVPLVNWAMMIGTILIASIYNNTTSLGNAYGVCVMFVTFFDTCMVTLGTIFVWKIKPYYVFLPWLTFASLDGAYLSSALTKVPDGAWFTLTLSAVLASGFILWRFGKESQWMSEAADRFPTSHFVRKRADGGLQLVERYGGSTMSSIKGFGVFFDKAGETTPTVFSQFAMKLIASPQVMVFFHLRPLERPTVPLEDRYVVSRLSIPYCYRVVVRHGYMDEIINPNLGHLIYEIVRDFIVKRGHGHGPLNPLAPTPPNESTTATATGADHPDPANPDITQDSNARTSMSQVSRTSSLPETSSKTHHVHLTDPSSSPSADATTDDRVSHEKQPIESHSRETTDDRPTTEQELTRIDEAYNHQILYVLGKVQLKILPKTNIVRRIVLGIFLFVRENTRNKIANLRVPVDRVVEVGFVKMI